MDLKLRLPSLPALPTLPSVLGLLDKLRRRLFPRGWLKIVAVLALVLPFGLFVGLLSAVGLAPILSFLLGGIAIVIFLIGHYGFTSYRFGGNGIFWTALVFALVLAAAEVMMPIRISGLYQIWIIALVPWIVYSVPAVLNSMATMRLVVALFVFAIVFAAIGTWQSPYLNVKAAIYQFLYNFKLPLMLLLGFRICWKDGDHRRLLHVFWVYALVVIGFIALDLGAPSVFKAVVRNLYEYHMNANPLLGGHGWRLTGPFLHPGILAYFSSLFLVMLVVQSQLRLVSVWQTLVLGSLLLVGLVASGQMQESSAALLCAAIVVVACRVRSIWTLLIGATLGGLVVAALFVGLVGTSTLSKLGAEWGLLPDVRALTSARPVLYADSARLADQFFPLGTGLGTFGGVGAAYINRSLYEALGYSALHWYQENLFLMDTYWPNIVAEYGWIGTIALLLVPAILNIYSLWRITKVQSPLLKAAWGYAFTGQFVPLLNSLTSPIYANPNASAFAMVMFGMAHMYERRTLAAAAEVTTPEDQATPPAPAWPGLRSRA